MENLQIGFNDLSPTCLQQWRSKLRLNALNQHPLHHTGVKLGWRSDQGDVGKQRDRVHLGSGKRRRGSWGQHGGSVVAGCGRRSWSVWVFTMTILGRYRGGACLYPTSPRSTCVHIFKKRTGRCRAIYKDIVVL